MKIFSSLLIIFLYVSPLWAYEVGHITKPQSNFETSSLNGACSTLSTSSEAFACNPALFIFNKNTEISIYAIGKAKGRSIDNTKNLIFDRIEESTVRALFNENNFNSFTGNSKFDFYNQYFILSYSPYYLLADILVTNPAFPEVSLALMNRNTISATSAIDAAKFTPFKNKARIGLGATLGYVQEEYLNTTFTLADLIIYNPRDLVKMKTQKYPNLDIGSYFELLNMPYVPQLSFQAKNIMTKHHRSKDTNSMSGLNIKNSFEPMTSLGMGYNYTLPIGALYSGIELPFGGFFNELYTHYASIGLKYNLGLFSFYGSHAEYVDTLSLLVKSTNTSIGILYSFEKEIRNFNVKRDNTVYLFLELILN